MSRGAAALLLGIVGLLVAVLSAAADVLGLGSHPGFGPRQTAGVLLGAAALIAGLIVWRRSRGSA